MTSDRFTLAWAAVQNAMPAGWRLDSVRCASTGLDAAQRSDRWRAIADGPGAAIEEVEAADPVAALTLLIEHVRRH